MEKDYKQIFDELINKKFAKSYTGGYDALEVDMFFDSIIKTIQKFIQNEKLYKEEIDRLKNEKIKMEERLDQKNKVIEIFKTESEILKKDGYGYANLLNRVTILEKNNQNKNNK